MDDLEKKLFAQFDDPMPAQRCNALESLREHLQKAGRKFRDLVADLENAISPEELEERLAKYIEANNAAAARDAQQRSEIKAAAARDAKQRSEIKTLKAALWVKVNWKIWGAVAAGLLVVVGGACAYERYWSRTDAVNAGLRAAVANATWGEGWGEPVASKIGGESWWLMIRGDIDASSYSDNHGNPVEMRCLHLYASPAAPYSGQFFKPSPRNFLGRVTWPELAQQCKPSPIQKADNIK